MQTKTVREIADYVGGRVLGSESVTIRAASTLDSAGPGQITFLSNPKYTPKVQATQAAAVLVSMPVTTSAVQIITDDPYYAFMQVVVLLHGHREHPPVGVSDKADIAPSARLGKGTQAAAFVSIGQNVTVGCNCYFYPGVSIGPNVQIGDDCIFYPNAVIYDGCRIGHRVIIQSNASVGQDGFGFATHKGVHHKIPQIGGVVLEDDVEIGAGCAIERGTLDDTVIGQGSKIGDAVAIGHGARIGPYCLLVPQVGISGSATLGHHCVLGGQAGVVGHIKIGNGARIGAQAGVINDVPDGATLVGAPAIDAGKARRAYSLIEYLPELRKKIRDLERRMDKRDRGSDGN